MKNKWKSIQNVVVVLLDSSRDKSSEFIHFLEQEGKNVKVVVFSDTKNEESESSKHIIVITKKDFNLLGRPKSENAKLFFSEKNDLLIAIDSFTDKSKKRLQKINADLKIGLNLKENDTFFDINMQTTSNSIVHLINFTKETLEKIH